MVRLPRTARDVLGWGRPPRQILRRGALFATVAPALTTAERLHIERVLGAGRVALCLVALATLAWDPTWNGSNGQLPVAMLGGYAVFGVLQLAGASRRRAVRLPSHVSHGVDVAVAAALTVTTVSLPSSPFLLFFLFAVLGAAYRWGAGASVLTAIVAVMVLCAEVLLGDVGVYGLLTWSASLLVTALVMGGLAELERQRRARASLASGTLARLHGGTSVHAAMRETSRTVLGMFAAERLVAVVHEPGTSAAYAWTARTRRSRTVVSVREIGAAERADYCFSAPGDAWQVRRDAASHVHVPDEIFEDARGRVVAGVDVSFAGQWTARVFLTRSNPLGATELVFFRELICQVAPALFSLYLVRRVRARVTATERSRVARELHDGIIQSLAGLRFDVAAVRRRAESGRPVVAELAGLEQALAEQTIAARELMHRMRPLDVTPRQLPAALGAIVERFTRETGIPAHYHTNLEDTDLAPRTCRELACTLQEALVNVRKHSAARHVVVRFSADPIHYRLTVDNDGRPFDFAGRLTLTELEAARRGPLVIKERVREMGGELVIESSADRGVRLDILLRRRLRARSSKTA